MLIVNRSETYNAERLSNDGDRSRYCNLPKRRERKVNAVFVVVECDENQRSVDSDKTSVH